MENVQRELSSPFVPPSRTTPLPLRSFSDPPQSSGDSKVPTSLLFMRYCRKLLRNWTRTRIRGFRGIGCSPLFHGWAGMRAGCVPTETKRFLFNLETAFCGWSPVREARESRLVIRDDYYSRTDLARDLFSDLFASSSDRSQSHSPARSTGKRLGF